MKLSEDSIVVLRKTAWTRSARATIDRARWWAEKHGNRRVAARHVLIALAETQDPRTVRVTAEVASLARLEFALANLRGSADEDGGSVSGIRDVALTPSGRALLERAVDAGSRTRGAAVQPEHLWLALASTDDVELRKLLALASSSVAALHATLRTLVSPPSEPLHAPSDPPPDARNEVPSHAPRAARPIELPAPPVPIVSIEPEHREHGNLFCAPGVRRAKLEGARLTDEELLRAATIVFQRSGDDGVREFVSTLDVDDRLRLARELKRRADDELRAFDPSARAARTTGAAELRADAEHANGNGDAEPEQPRPAPLDLAPSATRLSPSTRPLAAPHPLAPEPTLEPPRPLAPVPTLGSTPAVLDAEPGLESRVAPSPTEPTTARRPAARSLWDRLTGTLFPEREPGER
ncbi:MAG: hypothetical protein HZA52_01545 [Planctomycetes bacterium]|nr:hypothetical protein [Planctomycetota bacterium]